VFEKLDIESIKLDFSELEAQFAAKVVEAKKDANDKKKQGPVSILDAKTSQAVSIFLSQFKGKTPDDLTLGILTMDENMFNVTHIDGMLKLLPSSDDIQNINDFLKEHDASHLGIPENFALKLNSVPSLQLRLAAFKFKFVFPTKKSEISADMDNFRKGCKELMECKKMQKVLELILLVGNFVNGGTNRGNAVGFKLGSLTKITDTKSTDNKSTLMNYLTKVVQDQYPDHIDFTKELSHVEAASKVSMPTTAGEVASIKKEFVTITKSAEAIPKAGDNDKFQSLMSQFIPKATEDIDQLGSTFTQMEAEYKQLCDFFGEDTKTDPSELLGIFVKFIEAFEAAVKENEAVKMAAEKNAKREAAKKLKEEEDEKKKKLAADKKTGSGLGVVKNEAVVDELLSNITSGSMFQNRVRRPAVAPVAKPAAGVGFKPPTFGTKPGMVK